MHSVACSHMAFACAVWGYAFGAKLQLRATTAAGCARLSMLFMPALHWAIRAPSLTHLSVLFIIYNTLLLHGIIVKQIVQYYHGLERSLKHTRQLVLWYLAPTVLHQALAATGSTLGRKTPGGKHKQVYSTCGEQSLYRRAIAVAMLLPAAT